MALKESCRKCENKCRKCKIKMLCELNRQGMDACNNGCLEEAESKLWQALKVAVELDVPVLEANTLNSLGIVCSKRGVNDKAFSCYARALYLIEGKLDKDHYFHRSVNRNLDSVKELLGPKNFPPKVGDAVQYLGINMG